AVPTGAGPDHLLAAGRPLQYTIDFQNTGTDTAFRVLLRDDLDADLDITTFQPGLASHPYAWEIRNRRLEVLFSPITLPDSNVNEPASHGYFTFEINQVPGLPDGTVLENTASIIFDFNPPIVTNTVLHTIGQLVVRSDEPLQQPLFWQVFGNPTREAATFLAKEFIAGEKRFELHDAAGRPVRMAQFSGQMFVFQRDGLPAGLYFFRIGDAQGRWFTGKIAITE
ncbi:MAG TPA: T9SS type A sorting domain-containing protein, partial [Saprospiraceae bacterium]|nr:T9SS type A sorting domain-containing protein [Saprospiraceae bacterium]